MSSGLAYQFQGSQIQVSVGFNADSPAPAISGVTKANPAVVTATAHGLDDGDVIKISGVVGMTELNGRTFVVEKLTDNTFSLLGINSSAYNAYGSGGTWTQAEFSTYCELTNYNRTGGSSPEIDVTSQCSEAQENLLGLPDFGTTQIDYNFALKSAVQQVLQAADLSKDIIALKITLPEDGGFMVLLGRVQQTSEQAGVGDKWSGSTTIRNTGRRWDFA